MMSTFFIEKRSGGERIFRKAAVLTSEIFLDTVKIMLDFRDKKAPPDFSDGAIWGYLRKGASLSAVAGILFALQSGSGR